MDVVAYTTARSAKVRYRHDMKVEWGYCAATVQVSVMFATCIARLMVWNT